MIERLAGDRIKALLGAFPAVAILGPRQVGKTTLARRLSAGQPVLYLDLEDPVTRAQMQNARDYLERHLDKLVILDEVQRLPELFLSLRGLIDEARQSGRRNGRYLILGSASNELLRQSESLAGRISYMELQPVLATEFADRDRLWLRGGLPESLLAESDTASLSWRHNFVRTYLERDIPLLELRLPAATLDRFWTMLAHSQSGLWNAERFAAGLGISGVTVARYLDVLADLMLVRRLRPWHGNTGRRLVKSPKTYVRDSGIVHERLGIGDYEQLLRHPVVGGSWEGFVIENLLQVIRFPTQASFYRSAKGAEIDLVLEAGQRTIAIEVKRSSAPTLDAVFYRACETVKADTVYVVYPGTIRYLMTGGATAIGVAELMRELTAGCW